MQENYLFEKGIFRIQDPKLGIDFSVSHDLALKKKSLIIYSDLVSKLSSKHFHGPFRTFYPTGEKHLEGFFNNGKLIGPYHIFSKSQKVLSLSWFLNDLKIGKSSQFNELGDLVCQTGYNSKHQKVFEEHFYPNGQLKAYFPYRYGFLEGKARLYFSNSQLKREVEFKKGKKSGADRRWNFEGVLMEEHFFKGLTPIKTHRKWDSKGHLLEEKTFFHPKLFNYTKYNSFGDVTSQGIFCEKSSLYTEKIYKEHNEIISSNTYFWTGDQLIEQAE